MNWQRILTLSRRRTESPPSHRPSLEVLEDRTLLTMTTFTLSGTNSLAQTGSKFTYGTTDYAINEQGAGSLTTTFTGTIATDIDTVGHTITFLDTGTALTAGISGNWAPMPGGGSGTAPANYGGEFMFLGDNLSAIRNLVMGVTTAAPVALSRTGGPGVFAFPSTQTVKFNAGSNLDYSTGLFGNGTLNIGGLSATNQAASGTLQSDGSGNLTLTVPVVADIFYDIGGGASFTIHVTGTLNATGTLGTASAIGSFQLGGVQAVNPAPAGGVVSTASLGAPSGATVAAVADTAVSSAAVSDSSVVPAARVDGPAAVDVIFGDPVANGVLLF